MSHMWSTGDNRKPDEVVTVSLTKDQIQLLVHGLVAWDGPARSSEEMARAMGFNDGDHLSEDRKRIAADVRSGRALTRRDWTRALLATEVAFASDVVGSGIEWSTATGMDDDATLRVLRGIQLLLVGVVVRPTS